MFLDEDRTFYHNYNCVIDIKVYYDNCEICTESPDDLTIEPIKFDIYLSDFSHLVILSHYIIYYGESDKYKDIF
jgi:hypothetical protein